MPFFTNRGPTLISAAADEWAALDGRADAPTGAANYPTLLSGFAARPPWQVAGVDYRVGVQTGVTLKNPRTDTLPSGVTRNTTDNIFNVTGNNVTISAWDFTEGGGWKVKVFGDDCTIINCQFADTGTGDVGAWGEKAGPAGGLFHVSYCTFDTDVPLGKDGTCDLTVRYCLFKNAATDFIQFHTLTGGGHSTLDMKYCMFHTSGQAVGAHGDMLQCFSNEPISGTVSFCTAAENPVPGGFTQGFMFEPNGHPDPPGIGIITQAEVSNCTFVNNAGPDEWYFATGCTQTTLVGTFTVHQNYFTGPAYGDLDMAPDDGFRTGPTDGLPNTIFTGNVDLNTGLPRDND